MKLYPPGGRRIIPAFNWVNLLSNWTNIGRKQSEHLGNGSLKQTISCQFIHRDDPASLPPSSVPLFCPFNEQSCAGQSAGSWRPKLMEHPAYLKGGCGRLIVLHRSFADQTKSHFTHSTILHATQAFPGNDGKACMVKQEW